MSVIHPATAHRPCDSHNGPTSIVRIVQDEKAIRRLEDEVNIMQHHLREERATLSRQLHETQAQAEMKIQQLEFELSNLQAVQQDLETFATPIVEEVIVREQVIQVVQDETAIHRLEGELSTVRLQLEAEQSAKESLQHQLQDVHATADKDTQQLQFELENLQAAHQDLLTLLTPIIEEPQPIPPFTERVAKAWHILRGLPA